MSPSPVAIALPGHRHAGPFAGWRPAAAASFDPLATDRSHAALQAACRASGGIARSDDLARLFEYRDQGDYVRLARHLALREVFGYRWGERLWIPMFQFDLGDLSVHAASRAVIAELGAGFGGWSLACWFVEANDTLDGQRPLNLLHSDLAEVRAAARAFRHAIAG